MFFQIGLDSKDRGILRFLPFANGSSCNASNQWRFEVMPYGLICVPSIAGYCIKYTAQKNYGNASADTVVRIKRGFYVEKGLKLGGVESGGLGLGESQLGGLESGG